jgi:hypothetical protein
MSRVAAVLIILILCLGCYAAAAQSVSNSPEKKPEKGQAWEWMAVYPVYSYTGLLSPYYSYYYPTYSYAWPGVQPAYYYPTYLAWRYPTSPWWIGEHWDLGKTMQIARYGSSIRVYSPGGWQTV